MFDNFASLLGPTLGTLIYAKSDLSVIICINIISFMVCFILLMNLNYMHRSEPVENERKRKMNICAGLTYLKNNSNIMFIFFTFMVLNFLVAPTENVYAPGIIKVIFGFSDNLFGLTSTAVSIGIIIAGFSMTLFKRKSSILYSFYTQSIIMIATGIFSLFLRSQPMLFYVIYITLCLLSGYSSTFINVPMISYFQKNIEINQQTQFFSIMTLSSNIMVPLGTFIAGILCDLMGAIDQFGLHDFTGDGIPDVGIFESEAANTIPESERNNYVFYYMKESSGAQTAICLSEKDHGIS